MDLKARILKHARQGAKREFGEDVVGFTAINLWDAVVGNGHTIDLHFHWTETNEFIKSVERKNDGYAVILVPTGTLLIWNKYTCGRSPYLFTFDLRTREVDYGNREPFLDQLYKGMEKSEFDRIIKRSQPLTFDTSSIYYLGYVEPVSDETIFQDFYVMEDGKVIELPEYWEWADSFELPSVAPETKKQFRRDTERFDYGHMEYKTSVMENVSEGYSVYPIALSVSREQVEETEESYEFSFDPEFDAILVYFIHLDSDKNSVRYDSDFRYVLKLNYKVDELVLEGIPSKTSNPYAKELWKISSISLLDVVTDKVTKYKNWRYKSE
jgi:hypothetical protein